MSGMRHTWRFELKTRFNTPEMTLSKYRVKRLKWRFILKSAIKAPR